MYIESIQVEIKLYQTKTLSFQFEIICWYFCFLLDFCFNDECFLLEKSKNQSVINNIIPGSEVYTHKLVTMERMHYRVIFKGSKAGLNSEIFFKPSCCTKAKVPSCFTI